MILVYKKFDHKIKNLKGERQLKLVLKKPPLVPGAALLLEIRIKFYLPAIICFVSINFPSTYNE